jgi:hypothetical protein
MLQKEDQRLGNCSDDEQSGTKKSGQEFTNVTKAPQMPLKLIGIAVQERYNFLGFLSLPVASLRDIALRPLPCNYNVLEFVCGLSRR